MGYVCSVCGANEVDLPGGVCELCAIGQDPYAVNNDASAASNNTRQIYSIPTNDDGASNSKRNNRKVLLGGGASTANTDPYGNDMTVSNPTPNTTPSVPVYSAGQVPQQTGANPTAVNTQPVANAANTPVTSGIVRNIALDNQERKFYYKWGRTLFKGIPFMFDNEITMFQVFPDYSGSALNAMGNACDQVVVYGTLTHGAISENNDVEIFGKRDANNNIIAKTIRNKASGTIITPSRTLSPALAWILTLIALPIAFFVIPVVVVGLILKPLIKQLLK